MRGWEERRIGWRVVGSFPSFQQAQHAVDVLAAARFPIRRIMIVAAGLHPFDSRRGRPGYGWAALHGLLLGVPIAAVVGFLLLVAAFDDPIAAGLTVAAWAALAGGVAGAAIGVGVEALRFPGQPANRDLLQADRYDLVADDKVADQACRLLDRLRPHSPGEA